MPEFGQGTEVKEETSIRAKAGELLARVLYEKDKIIFREGQDGTDAFVVESGRVGVFKTTDGKPVRLATIEKGAIFGEMAAITGERRSATAIAIEPTVVVRISKTTIQQKISHCDPFIKALLAILINNLGRVNERYATTNKVAEKLLNDLKAAQADKPVEKPPEKAAEAPASGDRGVDGSPS
jgi:CRP-like cAMP-binding protein